MLELYAKWMKEDDILVYVPEYSDILFLDNLELPVWVAFESYYDFLRYIDIRDYKKVFDSFYDFMNGSEHYAISPKLEMINDKKEESYDVYNDTLDNYYTRGPKFQYKSVYIMQDPEYVNYESIENGLRNVINPLYQNVLLPRGVRLYMASVTMWKLSFPGKETQYQDFVDRIKEYILFPYISDVSKHLLEVNCCTDSFSHLTPEAAIENSIILSQEIKYQMYRDGIFENN